nr:hypothetical protein [Tanacetum cinerariifolium]
MISYLRNTEGYKMEFFKGLKYNDILLIFQAKFDANMRFLFKTREEMEEEDEEIIKSINETPAQKAAKRRRLHEQAKEDADLKKQLKVVVDEDDDVFIEATPIGRKVPVKKVSTARAILMLPDKMDDVNAPSDQTPTMAPPVRVDDQILPHIREKKGHSDCDSKHSVHQADHPPSLEEAQVPPKTRLSTPPV